MMRRQMRTWMCASLVVLLAASAAWGQPWRQAPRVGYAYPSGARQGKSVEVTIGGQYFNEKVDVYVSGEGVEAELVAYEKPLAQKDINKIREVFDAARKAAKEEAKDGKEPGPLVVRAKFLELAKGKDLTAHDLERFNEWRVRRNDPKRQLNPQLADTAKIRVTVSEGAAPGLRELRIMTRTGLSNPIRFEVGQFGEYDESEPNDSMEKATAVLSLPAVVNGQIMPGDVDRFRFKARKGQRLVVEVKARALVPYLADAVPGWFQATAALYDAEGREVAYDDDYRFDPDPVLLYQVPADGEYVLEIHDSIYRGREDFVYRIAVGELPFVQSIYPLGVKAGEKTVLAVEGWNLPADAARTTVSYDRRGLESFGLAASGVQSNRVPLAVDDLPERAEAEPNNSDSTAQTLTLPVIVNGRIDKPGDEDVFRFKANAGDRITAEVFARRLGSPMDSLLRIRDASGKEIGRNDDCEDKSCGLMTHHADSTLVVTIPKTGEYVAALVDAQHSGGKTYAYRLRIAAVRPDFELRVVPSAISARGGDVVPITVYALRREGFDGDIRLRMKDCEEGFILSGDWVPAGQEKAQLTLTVPQKTAGKLAEMHLEGYATIGGKEVTREATPADDWMQAFAYHHLVTTEKWTAAIEAVRWKKALWTVADGDMLKLNSGGETSVRVKAPAGTPTDKVHLELSDPPEGISIAKVTPVKDGVDCVLRTEPDMVKATPKGNLIINVFIDREQPAQNGQPARTQRTQMGAMPAVPFEIVGN